MNFVPDLNDIGELDIYYGLLLQERAHIMGQMMHNQNEINQTIDRIEGINQDASDVLGAA